MRESAWCSRPRRISAQHPIENSEVTPYQLRQYVFKKIPKLSAPSGAEQWTAEARRLRRKVLEQVVFQGRPRE